jgi:hypothetical protein
VGLRGTVGFESRTFFREYADEEINSPGEPGVFYFMGVGFREQPDPESQPGEVLADMLRRSHARNRGVIDRINSQLEGISVDYDEHVIPLTPQGNATERHIVRAYHERAIELAGGDSAKAAALWARNLGLGEAELAGLIADGNAFTDMLRSKMIKKGGLAYVQPTQETFPHLDGVVDMILQCQAIPTSAWLDGTRPGEADPEKQLECLIDKGVAAANIIPDRNWNVKDPAKAGRLVEELHRYAAVCRKLDLPVLVGTELNKPGQRFVDDFQADPMKPLHEQFLFGAQVAVGHTRLFRYADFSYVGKDAANEYPDRGERNRVFAAIGALPAPPVEARMKLDTAGPGKAFDFLQDCAARNEWLQ